MFKKKKITTIIIVIALIICMITFIQFKKKSELQKCEESIVDINGKGRILNEKCIGPSEDASM